MADDVKVTLAIQAIDKISKDVNKINTNVKKLSNVKPVKSLESSFNRLGSSIIVLNQGLQLATRAYRAVANSISTVTNLAAEQEKVEFLLADALKQKGKFTEEVFQQNLKLASSLQKVTTFGDEQIINAQKLLIQLGVEVTQLEAVTKATLDLSAAKGIDLTSAADLVSKSIGSTTNALSRYGIQIANSTDKTQRANDIVKEISRLFGGAASAEAQTYAGRLTQLGNVYGDLLETVGSFITQNSVVLNGIKSSTDIFGRLDKTLKDNRKTINEYIKSGVLVLLKGISAIVSVSNTFIKIFKSLNIAFNIGQGIILGYVSVLTKLLSVYTKIIGKTLEYIGLTDKLTKTSNKLKDISNAIVETTKDNFNEVSKGINNFNEYDNAIKSVTNSVEGLVEELDKVESKSVKIDLNTTTAGGGSIASLFTQIAEKFGKNLNEQLQKIGSSIAAGAEGARKLVTQVTTSIIDALAPGFGAVAAPLLDAFSKGPEFVKKMVTEFVEALPQVLNSLILGAIEFVKQLIIQLPTLVASIIEQIPLIIQGIVDNLDIIISNLISLAPRIITALAADAPRIITSIIAQLPRLLPKIVSGILKGIAQGFKSILSGIRQVIGDMVGFVDGILTGRRTTTTENLERVKFSKAATGLDVPNKPQFKNDNFPAMLSAGESVLTADTTQQLKGFLDQQINTNQQPQNVVIQLQVGEKQLADVMLELDRRGFRITA